MSDPELAEQIQAVEEMHDWKADEIAAWARSQDNRPLAAAIAAAVEQGRTSPREGLLRKLAGIS